MNPKILKYFLIVSVIVVWAMIAYRVIHGLEPAHAMPPPETVFVSTEQKDTAETFVLYADYPDPFIPEKDTQDIASPLKPFSNVPGTNLPLSNIPAPSLQPISREWVAAIIQFNGIVANPQKKSMVAFVTVRGKEFVVHENEKAEDVLIRRIQKRRVLIVYKGIGFAIEKTE